MGSEPMTPDELRARMARLEEERRELYTGDTAGPSYAHNWSHRRRQEIDDELARIRAELGLPAAEGPSRGTAGGWITLIAAIVLIMVTVGLWRP
ncbi:hypothetical protein [Microbacterium arborescens]|uniref:hypothetical protein n=1 Tax=Microbacterium arborescens TaxID=33883 RepID=UPI003C77DF86